MKKLALLLLLCSCNSQPLTKIPAEAAPKEDPHESLFKAVWQIDGHVEWRSRDKMCQTDPPKVPPLDTSKCGRGVCVGPNQLRFSCPDDWQIDIVDMPTFFERLDGPGLAINAMGQYKGQGAPDKGSTLYNKDGQPVHPLEMAGICQIQYLGTAYSSTAGHTPCIFLDGGVWGPR